MNKLALGFLGAAAMVMGSAASAALVTTGPTALTPATPTDSFTGATNCAVGQSPCTFSNSYTFVTPTGFNSLNVGVQSTAITGSVPSSDINFTNIIFNNGTSNVGTFAFFNGIIDNASLTGINLIAGATNTLTILSSAANAGAVDANFGGSLAFASVPAVPEPGTWALMLVGFGGMGVAMRRSRKRVVAQLA